MHHEKLDLPISKEKAETWQSGVGFASSFGNAIFSRHGILRLYWTAYICDDKARSDNLELLPTLWQIEDFMTAVTERSTANLKVQVQWFLEFCADDANNDELFNKKSIEGKRKYLKMAKLHLADSKLITFQNSSRAEFDAYLKESLAAC